MRVVAFACLLCALAAAQTPAGRTVDIGLESAPLSSDDRAALAQAFSAHDYAAESAVLTRVLTASPDSRDLWIIAGRIAFLERHPADAADAFEKADALQSLGEADRTSLALAYQALGKLAQSRAQFVQLTTAAPKNGNYFYLLARVDRQNLDPQTAMSNYRTAINLAPGLARAWEELAQLQEQRGQIADARKTLEKAVEENRQQKVHSEALPLDLGQILLHAGELADAEKLFRESVEYNPRFAAGHYYLGQALEKEQKNDAAVTEYRSAVVHSPTFRPAWLALGELYTKMGMKTEAEGALRNADKLAAR
jgi:tetratricopeptide (TPR) repeat protein